MVSNKKVFDVYLIPENTPDINNSLNQISKIIKLSFTEKEKL